MPSWHQLLTEIKVSGSTFDVVRRRHLRRLSKYTGRNAIAYYSGWLQKPGMKSALSVNDADKNGFMTVIHGMDRKKGLDLLLHTPGGEISATESIVDYLFKMFNGDIRAIIPQLAMSAGTMIACACREILMGKQSSLGPIDPQFGGVFPAHGVIEEFKRAYNEIKEDAAKIHLWQPVIAKYSPTLIGECEKAIEWSTEMTSEWLKRCMFKDVPDNDDTIKHIIDELGNHALTKSHSRHLSAEKCQGFGLNVIMLENDQKLQDAVLTVHHACIHTLSSTPAYKIIENDKGVAFIQGLKTVLVQADDVD